MPQPADDLDWLGAEVASDGLHATLRVQPAQTNPTGRLYGGVAVATSIAMMESCSGRAVTWVTVQFSSSCTAGEVIDLAVTVSAVGRRTSQLRLAASVGGRRIFDALGAVVALSPGGAEELQGQWEAMPAVAPPEECPAFLWLPPRAGREAGGWGEGESHLAQSDLRVAAGFDGPPASRVALWCHPLQVPRLSAAVLGWQADLMGIAFVRATGGTGGTSLDNTMRFGPPAPPDIGWVLADLRAHVLVDGYGHGTVFLWARDGTLLAVGSQTCIMRRAD